MAEQSFLNKLGLRLGILGSSAALAIAAPLATGNYDPSCHTDAARIGFYFDRTAAAEKIGIIVGGQTGPIYTRSGTVVNAQYTGIVTVGDGTASATFNINGAAGTVRRHAYMTASVLRWTMDTNNTAESGSNAGSDFVITAYTDAGAVIDTPFTAVRAALGVITLARPTTLSAGTLTGAQVALSITATWNNGASTFNGLSVDITDTASATASVLLSISQSGNSRFKVQKQGYITSSVIDTDTLTTAAVVLSRTSTITGNVTDAVNASLGATINGAFTVTRFNYIRLLNIGGTSTVTNGCVFDFNAAAGTHKAVDAATTKSTPGGVDAWMKHNINGTVFFQPLYTSKTA